MSQPAIFEARAVYDREPTHRTFREDLDLHLIHGYVFNLPDVFIMGRPVNSKAEQNQILDPLYPFKLHEQDCWHVFLYAGNLTKAFTFLPYWLPYCSFERDDTLRVYSTTILESKIHGKRTEST